MRFYALLISACAFLSPASATFADEAYEIDYHQPLLGIPQSQTTFFQRPQSSSNASLLYTISDKAVLGAVNPKDGSLVWRQILAENSSTDGASARLVAGDGDGVVISALGQSVSAWGALDGKLVWSIAVPTAKVLKDLQMVPSIEATSDSKPQDVIVLASGDSTLGEPSTIQRLDGETGLLKWEYSDDSGNTPILITVSATNVYYVSTHTPLIGSGKVRVTALDPISGRQTNQYSMSLGADPTLYASSCTSSPFLVCSEKPFKTIKINLLGSTKISTLTLNSNSGEEIDDITIHSPCRTNALPHFLVQLQTRSLQWAEVFHADIKTGDVSKAYSLPATQEPGTFASSSIDANVYFTRVTQTEVSLFSSASHGILGRWPRTPKNWSKTGKYAANSPHAVSEVAARGQSSFAVRVAETSSEGEWTLVRNGETVWSRPEMLAYVVAATWADDGNEASLAHELEIEGLSNPLSAYTHRLKRHAHDLIYLPGWIRQLPRRIISGFLSGNPTNPKDMLGSKTVIVATSHLQIYALDVFDAGAIKWRQLAGEVGSRNQPIKSLSALNGRINVYLLDGSVGMVLNVTNGALIDQQSGMTPCKTMIEVPGISGPVPIRVLPDGTPVLAAELAPSLTIEGNILVTIADKGQAMGWAIGQSMRQLWSFIPGSGFKLVNAVARPSHDPVASIGKVLGNRSVLYKYLSPNLALLTAVSDTNLTIYLVEAVTGAILYTASHSNVDTSYPIPSIISENWFAYSFFQLDPTSSQSHQLVISELYESEFPNDRGPLNSVTNYSSFDPAAITKPHVITQAFTIAEPISNMAVTQTAQGITVRLLLCTLPDSNAIIGIPRFILDPRRPLGRDPTPLEVEEGLQKYSPVLDLDPKLQLTHAREVMGVKKVISSPTLLESTSLVFGFGHDIFGSRIAPSMAFDVLGKGFNKVGLLLTVVALGSGVAIFAPMVKRRQVEGRWKMMQ